MKLKLTLVLICISTFIYSQERWTYQSDSVYKANKVKARKWFNGNSLTATTFYDKEGRMIKFQYEPFVGGGQTTTYFEYDQKGKLVKQTDTIKNGKPDEKALKKLEDLGLALPSTTRDSKPNIEVSAYEINYINGEKVKSTQYNPDGSLYIVDNFENNGRIEIRDWYRDGKVYQHTTTEYMDDFHKEKYYGWEMRRDLTKDEWIYTFEYIFENGRVKEFTRFDNGEKKEKTKLEYNKKGLLVKATYYTVERFEYDYYN